MSLHFRLGTMTATTSEGLFVILPFRQNLKSLPNVTNIDNNMNAAKLKINNLILVNDVALIAPDSESGLRLNDSSFLNLFENFSIVLLVS